MKTWRCESRQRRASCFPNGAFPNSDAGRGLASRLFSWVVPLVLALVLSGCGGIGPFENDIDPPGEVTSLSVVSRDGALDVSWVDPKDADFKSVYLTAAGQTLVANKGAQNQRINGLTNGQPYAIIVRTADQKGNRSDGVSASGTPSAPVDVTPPGEVTSLSATPGNGQATLHWVDPTDVDFQGVEVTANSVTAISVAKGATTTTVAGLTNTVAVTFLVRTIDTSGNKSPGSSVTVTPTSSDTTAPADVTNLAVAAGNGQIVVTWTDPTDGDFASTLVTLSGGGESTVSKGVQTKTFSGLTNNKSYTVTVRSVDGNGNSSPGVSALGMPLGTWAAASNAGSRFWWAVALSNDGTKLAAAVNPGYIMTSADSGTTWTTQTGSGSRSWYALASSSDGQKLFAAHDTGSLYTSADAGVTWTPRTISGSHLWSTVASSADGTRLTAASWGGGIYGSADSGSTWTLQSAGNRNWVVVANSSDGAILYAVDTSPGYVYRSMDFGVTWSPLTDAGLKDWYGVSCSLDGSRVVALDKVAGTIVTSQDSGSTWVTRGAAGQREWYSVGMSGDGMVIAAGVLDGYVYLSTDAGVTWTEQTAAGPGKWKSVAVSADGSRIAAADFQSAGKLMLYR